MAQVSPVELLEQQPAQSLVPLYALLPAVGPAFAVLRVLSVGSLAALVAPPFPPQPLAAFVVPPSPF